MPLKRFIGIENRPVVVEKERLILREKSEESKKEENKQGYKTPSRLQKRKLLFGSIILTVLLAIAAILAYPKIFRRDKLEKLRSTGEKISVAVMPFKNMTNDTIWNVWQDGIQDILITFLSNSEELRVRDPESVKSIIQSEGLLNYSSITPDDARAISQKLDANIFIYGNIKRAGNILRLYAQLIDSKSAEVFKSFQIEDTNNEENIFQLVDSLSGKIRDFLIVHELQKGHSHEIKQSCLHISDAYR
jgi:TolB-like protein